MAKRDIDVEQIGELLKLVEAHGLAELTVEEGDLVITIKGSAQLASQPVVTSSPVVAVQVPDPSVPECAPAVAEPVEERPSEPEPDGKIVDIVAPLVGVFYRAPAPDAPPFVEVGDHIEVGTEIGLIEAMKVFSPIPSDVAGVVVAIPAENGKLVQKGETLVRVRVEE
ncbi:MAG: acetyl-CoA carboxylase biotin carboxyl carrier protein [Armatimonadota bacterium]|nr:acetyl-CoA carboxylase biotin carboxyl carrier protein [Armatimonadota bacterium]